MPLNPYFWNIYRGARRPARAVRRSGGSCRCREQHSGVRGGTLLIGKRARGAAPGRWGGGGLMATDPVEAAAAVWDAAEQSQRLAWQVAVDAAGVGTFDWDVATGMLSWDERYARLFGHDQVAGLRSGTRDY